jgi:hypothetical protein
MIARLTVRMLATDDQHAIVRMTNAQNSHRSWPAPTPNSTKSCLKKSQASPTLLEVKLLSLQSTSSATRNESLRSSAVTGKVALLARDRSINDATRRRTEIQARIT